MIPARDGIGGAEIIPLISRLRTLLTSNRPLEDWGKLLRDNAASSAILDRLLHRGYLLKFEGKSYRLKEASLRLTENKRKSVG